MNAKITATFKTFAKYLFWTVISAVIVAVTNNIGEFGIPDMWIPVIGAVLKAIATFVATKTEEFQL